MATPVLWILLAACILRLWVMPLASSFSLDEMATLQRFLSTQHPVLSTSGVLSTYPEIAYRLPSSLAMLASMGVVARLAARLIHPRAAWFAVFACLALPAFNYQAADAQMHSAGICVAAAALFFLVRWLDWARWKDAALFVACAALLSRIQFHYWPMYVVFVIYALVRLRSGETWVEWREAGIVFAGIAVSIVPVLVNTARVSQRAGAASPSVRDLQDALYLGLIAGCCAVAAMLSRWFRWLPDTILPARSSLVLAAGWWLCPPLALFAASVFTGSSAFSAGPLALALPAVGLVAAAAVTLFTPEEQWKPLAAALALAVLLFNGQWSHVWPRHQSSDWRAAARVLESLPIKPDTPVIGPGPVLAAYPAAGKLYSLPQSEQLARALVQQKLRASGQFVICGSGADVQFWRDWFAARPELAGWSKQRLGSYGDVQIFLFQRQPSSSDSDHREEHAALA